MGHTNAIFDLDWMSNEMKFVSGSGDHTSRLYDCSNERISEVRVFSRHQRSVKTVSFRRDDDNTFASGGRDGAIFIWDIRVQSCNNCLLKKADNCIINSHSNMSEDAHSSVSSRTKSKSISSNCSVTGLAFQNSDILYSSGAGDGFIKAWDLRRYYTSHKREPCPLYTIPYPGTSAFTGYTNLLIDQAGVRLYANCVDNTIYCFDLASHSTTPVMKYTGLKNTTFYIKSVLSPDDKYILSGSSDNNAYIWNVNNSNPVVILEGHTAEVTSVDWSKDRMLRLITCSDDTFHKVWEIGPDSDEIKNNLNEFRGRAVPCQDYKLHVKPKLHCRAPLNTPKMERRYTIRSLKMTREKQKRPFSKLLEEDETMENSSPEQETRVKRRLIEPGFTKSPTSPFGSLEGCAALPDVVPHTPKSSLKIYPLSPHNDNVSNVSPPRERISLKNVVQLFSPTSHLPNYVINGEAPHLKLVSPQRKHQEEINWLNQLRAERLMKLKREREVCSEQRNSENINNPAILSPRIQNIKAENSPSTERRKRRLSRSNSTKLYNKDCSPLSSPGTPTSRRQDTDKTLLHFFPLTRK